MMQIDVQDLVFSYGGADVLQGVSFCADKGERIAVLGPNGVGKSTLFRCLLGFLEPKRGCVKIAGRDVQAYSRRALAVIGAAGGGAGLYPAVVPPGLRPYGARERPDGPERAARHL